MDKPDYNVGKLTEHELNFKTMDSEIDDNSIKSIKLKKLFASVIDSNSDRPLEDVLSELELLIQELRKHI